MKIELATPEIPPWRETSWLGWLYLGMVVVFTWLPYSYYQMVSWPWILVWQIGFLLLGIWAIWLLRQGRSPFKLLGYGLDWGAGLAGLALVFSGVFCQFKEVAAWYASIALFYAVLLYVSRNWLGQGILTINRLWLGIPAVGVGMSIISLLTWWQNWTVEDSRNGWTLGHPNFVAGYLLLILPLTFFLALSRQGWQRMAGLAASGLFLFVLYTTSSRGGFLGLLLFSLVGAGFWLGQSPSKVRLKRLWLLLAALGVIVALALSNPRVQQIVQINSATAPVQVKIDGESWERLLMWQASFAIFKTHPLFGVGPGNMSRVYDLYRPPTAGQAMTHLQQLHNTPIQILGELGLVGLAAYGWILGSLGYLWYRLYRKLSQPQERYLLYGIGGGLLAYTFSSLTDYQLENIPISTTLVFLIVLLIKLGDEHLLSEVKSLENSWRRWLSLAGIVALVAISLFWLPISRAMALSFQSEQNFQAGNVTQAYQQAALAAELVPWDPTYNLLAGFETLKIREKAEDKKLFQDLTKIALGHLEKVVQAAPNDAPFNQVLAMLYRDNQDDNKAIFHLNRATELFPRTPLYTYYLLGREYLQQNQREKGIKSLALEGLINPGFLTSGLWQKPPLAQVKLAVSQENFKFLFRVLQNLGKNNPGYNLFYQNLIVLKWWYQEPIENLEINRLTPISKALLLAEKSPNSALEILNKAIKDSDNPAPLMLLRAWLNPEQYLAEYFQVSAGKISEQEKQLIQQSIYQNRQLRPWLSSLIETPKYAPKVALILTYRNSQGRNLNYIPLPPELETNLIVNLLQLFLQPPVIFPPFDSTLHDLVVSYQ